MRYCKPVSRILFIHLRQRLRRTSYHLSGITITGYLYLPTLKHRASSPQTLLYVAFQPARFTRILQSLVTAVSSYLTFSPLPNAIACVSTSKNKAVIFCGTVSFFFQRRPAVSGMRCSVLSGLSLALLAPR